MVAVVKLSSHPIKFQVATDLFCVRRWRMNRTLLDRICQENCVHPFWIVHEAYEYRGDPNWAWKAKMICKHFKELEELPEEVDDFCLDVLAHRITLRQPTRSIIESARNVPVEFQQ